MPVAETLSPLVLLVALGVFLARVRFLSAAFMADLNRFTFWVALPALLFREAAHAERPSGSTWRLLAVLVAVTLISPHSSRGLWVCCSAYRAAAQGTLVQSAFRGNLAYIGLPVVMYSLVDLTPGARTAGARHHGDRDDADDGGVQRARGHRARSEPAARRQKRASAMRGILTNPLLLSGLAGIAVSFLLRGAAGGARPDARHAWRIGGSHRTRLHRRIVHDRARARPRTAGSPPPPC